MLKSLVAAAAASTLLVITPLVHADEPTSTTDTPLPALPAAAPAPAASPPTTTATTATSPTTSPKPPPPKRSPGPIVTVIVGGVGVLTGLAFYSLASTKESQAKSIDSADDSLHSVGMSGIGSGPKMREEADGLRSTGNVIVAGGLIAMAGGFVWMAIDRQASKPKTTAGVSLTPTMGLTGAGASLQGTF